MKPIPDYFIALVKQHANLVGSSDAERAIRAITIVLDANIDPKRAEYLFSILPVYLRPSRQKFFVRLMDWQPHYKHVTMLERLKASLQLTDSIEATVLLRAYFGAIKVVINPQDKLKLARALPSELNQIYIKA